MEPVGPTAIARRDDHADPPRSTGMVGGRRRDSRDLRPLFASCGRSEQPGRDADEVGGCYCENCHVGEIVPDDRKISANSVGVRGYALDPERAKALWTKSEQMVGERF